MAKAYGVESSLVMIFLQEYYDTVAPCQYTSRSEEDRAHLAILSSCRPSSFWLDRCPPSFSALPASLVALRLLRAASLVCAQRCVSLDSETEGCNKSTYAYIASVSRLMRMSSRSFHFSNSACASRPSVSSTSGKTSATSSVFATIRQFRFVHDGDVATSVKGMKERRTSSHLSQDAVGDEIVRLLLALERFQFSFRLERFRIEFLGSLGDGVTVASVRCRKRLAFCSSLTDDHAL